MADRIVVVVDPTPVREVITIPVGPQGPAGAAGPTGPAGPAGATNLDALTDVVVSSPQANEVLMYDTGTAKWVNEPVDSLFSVIDGGNF